MNEPDELPAEEEEPESGDGGGSLGAGGKMLGGFPIGGGGGDGWYFQLLSAIHCVTFQPNPFQVGLVSGATLSPWTHIAATFTLTSAPFKVG